MKGYTLAEAHYILLNRRKICPPRQHAFSHDGKCSSCGYPREQR